MAAASNRIVPVAAGAAYPHKAANLAGIAAANPERSAAQRVRLTDYHSSQEPLNSIEAGLRARQIEPILPVA